MNTSFLNSIRRYRWYLLGRLRIKKEIKSKSSAGKLKIILGAGPTEYEGCISTDIPHFDILKEDDWQFFFSKYQINNILIEHVLEHLTKEQVMRVLSLSYKYLKPHGCLRIAVPDGYHPDPEYIKLIAPPSDGHQSIWNIDTIQNICTDNGFSTEPLEYYTAKGIFTFKDFDFANGNIIRSRTKGFQSENHPLYSSLIVDAYKKSN